MAKNNPALVEQFNSARRVGVPFVAVCTVDQWATISKLREAEQAKPYPLVQWDAARGITEVNDKGAEALKKVGIKSADTIGFSEAMLAARMLPGTALLFVHNAGRQLASIDPIATATAVQAVSNLRDVFKLDFRQLVLLAADFVAPPELAHDIVILQDPLPGPDELGVILDELHGSAKLKAQTPVDRDRAVEALSGLSAFESEQVAAMSLTPTGIEHDALWDRKCVTIEQTPGLSVYRGGELFSDLRGLASVKRRLTQHVNAKTPVGVVVWIDEGADVFSNVENDTSGNKTDQQRELLIEMENNGWRGIVGVGVPGSGKSAIAKAFGNEAKVPTIAIDFGAMESKWVGESGAQLRQAIKVIKAVGRGNAFFVLTANSLKGIRPQFQARFRRGIFFFDLPTADEREAIWQLYEKKYAIKKQPRPNDDGWVGREIHECCQSAWDLGTTLIEASKYIVPVSRSRASEIETMRKEAHGRFLDASHEGEYTYDEKPMAKQVRAVSLSPGVMVPGSGTMQ